MVHSPPRHQQRGATDEPFVGRAQEIARVRELAVRATQGESWLVIIDGESGMGKSALMRHLDHVLTGFTVISAVADREHVHVQGAILDQLVDRVGALAAHPGIDRPSSVRLAEAVAVAQVATLVDRLDRQRPTALLIDDADWVDDVSMRTILLALRQLPDAGILTIVALRIDQAVRRSQWLAFASGHPRATVLTLGGFSRPEIAELARTMLGRAISDTEVAALQNRTAGHVLYLRTLLADRPIVDGGQDQFEVPATLMATIQLQLSVLSDTARKLVEALAVVNARLPLRFSIQVAGLADPDVVLEALNTLIELGFVTWRPSEPTTPISLRHMLQRDAIYAQLSPQHRRRMHLQAAKVFTGLAHWRHRVAAAAGVPDAALAAALESAADDESAIGRHSTAATYLLWASRLTKDREHFEQLTVRAFVELRTVNQLDRIVQLRDQLLECAPSFRRDVALVMGYAASGDKAACRHHADQAWREAQSSSQQADLATFGAFSLAGGFLFSGAPQDAIDSARWALDLGTLDEHHRSITWGLLAWATLMTDGSPAALRAIHAAPSAVNTATADLLAVRGMLEAIDGRLSAAAVHLQASLRLALGGAIINIGRRAWGFVVWIHFLRGDWQEALTAARQTEDSSRLRLPWYDDAFDVLPGIWVAAARGDWADARRKLAVVEHAEQAAEHRGAAACSAIGRAVIAYFRGDLRSVYESLTPLQLNPLYGVPLLLAQTATWWPPLLAEAQIATGHIDDAEATLRRLGPVDDVPYLYLQVARLHGLIHERRGNRESAMQALRAAIEFPVTENDAPMYRGLAHLSYGKSLRAGGQKDAAVVQLHHAERFFKGLQATPLLQQCTTELIKCGLGLPQLHIPNTKLTDREHEIARHVGAGKTNREIAAELFIGPKTVEYHLGNIYLKLGISGRRELRALVQQEPTA